MNRLNPLALLIAMLIFAAGTGGLAAPAGAEVPLYMENEWNFAEDSMDASGGIPENAAGVLSRIRRSGVLRVGTENSEGADMELARRIAERMGVRLEIVRMDALQMLPALSEDRCDLTISEISYTPGRATAYSLSKGYYYPEGGSVTGLVIREEDREILVSRESLEGRVLIARSNSLQEALAADQIPYYREFRRASSIQAVFEAVQQGKADAGVVDLATARSYLDSHPDCGLVTAEGFTIEPDRHYLGYRVAAKKGELQLIYFVNGVIDEVLESGEYLQWKGDAQ